MLTHRGFSCWIVSDSAHLPEHLVAVEESANKVSCWIPSEEGKTFSVYFRDHGSQVDTCTFITLDGFVVPGRFLHGFGEASRKGVRSGANTEKPFVFAKTDEPNGVVDMKKEVGTITVRIKRVERVAVRPANTVQAIPNTHGNPEIADHCVGYGEDEESVQHPTTWSVKLLDRPSTYVTFIFRYRSHDFLVAQGIMPIPGLPLGSEHTQPRLTARRVVSAPVVLTIAESPATPATPSPTPSPKTNKRKRATHAGARAKDELLGTARGTKPMGPSFRPPAEKPSKSNDISQPMPVDNQLFLGETMLRLDTDPFQMEPDNTWGGSISPLDTMVNPDSTSGLMGAFWGGENFLSL